MASMNGLNDFAGVPIRAMELKDEYDNDCISCEKCGSQWFLERACAKFLKDYQVVVGQSTPTKLGMVPEFLLECVRCGHRVMPAIIPTARDVAGNQHENFLDTFEGKFDNRPEEVAKRIEEAKSEKAKNPMTTKAGPRTFADLPVLRPGMPQGITPKTQGADLDPPKPKQNV